MPQIGTLDFWVNQSFEEGQADSVCGAEDVRRSKELKELLQW